MLESPLIPKNTSLLSINESQMLPVFKASAKHRRREGSDQGVHPYVPVLGTPVAKHMTVAARTGSARRARASLMLRHPMRSHSGIRFS
jgi:hypothetical protein